MKSDISRLWMFWRSPREAKAWIALAAVSAENLRGVRPREWTRSRVGEIDTPGEQGRYTKRGDCFRQSPAERGGRVNPR